MAPGSVILPAAIQLAPFQQGDGSALCGLYSILNAVQLALWPHRKLTQGELKRLINLSAKSTSSGLLDVLGHGIDEEAWLRLCRELLVAASDLTGYQLRPKFFLRSRAGDRTDTAIRSIKRQLMANRPVVVMLWGSYNHATVISGITQQRLCLFDSTGFKWVHRTSVGLDHPWSTKLHRIPKRSVMAITYSTKSEW